MWLMTIPITKMPTNRSSSTPTSTRRRHRLVKELSEHEDAVLQDEIARDLRDRLAPRRQEKEPGEHGAQRGGHDQQVVMLGGEREVVGEENGQPRPDRAQEDGRDEPEVGLDLVPDVHFSQRPEEHRGNDDCLDDRRDEDEQRQARRRRR